MQFTVITFHSMEITMIKNLKEEYDMYTKDMPEEYKEYIDFVALKFILIILMFPITLMILLLIG